MQTFKDLPIDTHIYLSEFLTPRDCASLAQTCTTLRQKYKDLRWSYCLVLPHSPGALVPTYQHSRAIPIAAATAPEKYSWIPADAIKILEFDESTNNEKVDKAMWSFVEALRTPYPHATFPSVTRTIVNLNYRSTPAFVQSVWARSLTEANGPILDIRRPPIEDLEDDEDRESTVDLDQEHQWIFRLEKNISKSHLLAESTRSFFANPEPIVLGFLRDLTITITSQSRFSLAASLPTLTPALTNLNIHWMIPDPFNPCNNLSPAIVSLNDLNPASLPQLLKCTLEIPNVDADLSGEFNLASLPVLIIAPIVTNIEIKSRALNISQFQHCFKFPNLYHMSIVLTSMVLYTLKPLPDPMATDAVFKWNRPHSLELVITERSTTDKKLIDLIRYLFADQSLKRVKVTLDSEKMKPSGVLFRGISHLMRDISKTDQPLDSSNDKLKSLVIEAIDELHALDVMDVFVFGTCLQNISSITEVVLNGFEDPLSLQDVDQELWDVFMVGLYRGLIYPTLVTETILSLANESKSLEYLHFDILNTLSRYFSPALNNIIESESLHQLKQVLLSSRVPELELKNDEWIKDLPFSPNTYTVFGEKRDNERIVQTCIDLEHKCHLMKERVNKEASSDPLWDSWEISKKDFNGWLQL
ncbi:uncharacterized protein SAPINGB_P000451 [Magnusiomyces paraingens]|uniref:F-box domain-containing protein n=1 Tax=Magnusiomyces paraingens TaxID=2606893 RepID=A0A5E8AZF1_9ASCO|nr:uncharacterized protein SAPINGB_P000451 [Saprochaete ingens]VVT44542.1 unnamed protein product [Saprochaete ingens]